jgi:hypothetical protein
MAWFPQKNLAPLTIALRMSSVLPPAKAQFKVDVSGANRYRFRASPARRFPAESEINLRSFI